MLSAQSQIVSENLIVGMVQGQMDQAVEKAGHLSGDQANSLIAMHSTLTTVIPYKDEIGAAMADVIALHPTEEKDDIWDERTVTFTGNEGHSPVVVGVWDSGVDTGVFGVRVVNMSWGFSIPEIETNLEANGIGEDAEGRREKARAMFKVAREGLVDAMESAGGILFCVAAGNSDNDVEFDEFIPSSFDLPNVANLAAKLIAREPALSPEETIRLIIEGDEDLGKDAKTMLVINPKRSMALLSERQHTSP